MRTGVAGRLGQAISKLFFCLRVAGDAKTFFRLLLQSKMHFDKPTEALRYHIRFLSAERVIYLRTYAGDIRIFYELFWERIYWLPPGGPSMSHVPETPLVIVDVGANIGMAALYFSIVYPQARIYCIEPDAHNFKLLQKNLAAEGERCVLIEAALYDRDGEVGFARERWAYNSRIDERADGSEDRLPDRLADRVEDRRIVVPAVTMDTLVDRFQLSRIDLLKIDIEGAEEKLFGGPTTWLEKVNTILIEVHSVEAVGPIRRRLEGNGFRWELRDDPHPGQTGSENGNCSLYLASRVEMPRLVNS
jgi:FkbM family methyltransferase